MELVVEISIGCEHNVAQALGGWAAILYTEGPKGKRSKTLSGTEKSYTALGLLGRAAEEGLKALKRTCNVQVLTDNLTFVQSAREDFKDLEILAGVAEAAEDHDVHWQPSNDPLVVKAHEAARKTLRKAEVPDLKAARQMIQDALWPPECLWEEAKYGHKAARLYPLLNRRVDTPYGQGILLQALTAGAQVLLDSAEPSVPRPGYKKYAPMTQVSIGSVRPLSPELGPVVWDRGHLEENVDTVEVEQMEGEL